MCSRLARGLLRVDTKAHGSGHAGHFGKTTKQARTMGENDFRRDCGRSDFRWGLLTFLLWGLVTLSIDQTISFWIALLLSGILFGLAHLPAYLLEGCKPTPLLIGAAVGGNLWVTIICGFLMYRYGLIAAMVVHILSMFYGILFNRKEL